MLATATAIWVRRLLSSMRVVAPLASEMPCFCASTSVAMPLDRVPASAWLLSSNWPK